MKKKDGALNIKVESAHVITEKDLNAILSAIDPQSPDNPWHESDVRARNQLILLLLFTGLRSREVIQLRIDDIDFDSGLLWVGYHPRPKREIPLPQNLLDLLHSYLHRKDRPATDHDYCFVTHRAGKRMTAQSLSEIFSEIQTKVPGISVRLTAHEFRRAWIKSLLAGIPLHTIQNAPVMHVSHYHKTGLVAAANMKNFITKMMKQSKKKK